MSAQHTIVVTTKNEGPFLLEWIAYHRLIGFDNVVVFANDCTDGSDVLLQHLSDAGLIRYYDNTDTPEGLPADPQNRAYRRAFAMDHVTGSDWVMVLDADEFLNIHAGHGTLTDLLDAAGPADVISGTWRIFGNAGRIAYEDGLVTAQFTRAAPVDVQVSFRHFGLKTLFRPAPVHRLGIHRPFLKSDYKRPEAPLIWRNGSGLDVTETYRTTGWSASMATKGYDLCQINHYMIKSNALFLMKRHRGTANSRDADRVNLDYYDSFNANHTTDDSMLRWSAAIGAEIARIRAAHPQVAEAHDACTAFFHRKIDTLIAGLRAEDPETTARLLDPGAVMAEIARDVDWLARQRGADRPVTGPVTGPVTERVDGPTAATPPVAPAAPVAPPTIEPDDAAPAWLADLTRSQHRRGFYQADVQFAAHYVARDPACLVVSFDNLSTVNATSLARDSWGYTFYRDEGWSHFGVLSFAANWYRDEALFDYMEGLAAAGFFAPFARVVLTGTSMGGYAATAFARLIPGCTVVAYSPQSTLDTTRVPWETRFPAGRAQDWTGRYRDATEGLQDAERIFILSDPWCAPDRQHAERYAGDNVLRLATWFSAHKSALFLRRADILKDVMRLAVAGRLDGPAYYRLFRARRGLPWYVTALVERACATGHTRLAARVAAMMHRTRRPHLARTLDARLAAEAAPTAGQGS